MIYEKVTEVVERDPTPDELLERAYVLGYLNQEIPDGENLMDVMCSQNIVERWDKVKAFLSTLKIRVS